jgi:hypothetical protein
MRDLKNELQSLDHEKHDESHKKKAVEALKRMESWNLFSDTHEVYHSVVGQGLLCCLFPFDLLKIHIMRGKNLCIWLEESFLGF